MCGIVGYIGGNHDIRPGLEALKRLEYRGYDSAGMAVYDPEKEDVVSVKEVGKVENLERRLEGMDVSGSPYIFYTRWATHGGVTQANCHPHSDCKGNVWIAHNGIIENHQQLKDKLIQEGHVFRSETDSEVISHMIERFNKGDLEYAVRVTASLLRGAFAFVVISKDEPDKLIAVRHSAPLLVGMGDGEYMAASDPSAVVSMTKEVVYLEDGDMAVLTKDGYKVQKWIDGKAVEKVVNEVDWDIEEAQKGGYEHFMLKEIMEQPESIRNTLRGRLVIDEGNAKLGGLDLVKERLANIDRIHIIACGTALYAGMVADYMIEEHAGIPVEVETASEFRYKSPAIGDNTAYIFISQSGETADTLAALRLVKEQGGLALGVVNVVGSTIARETDAGVYNHAGPEIGVASTKAFTSQITVMALMTLMLARQRSMTKEEGRRLAEEIERLPELVRSCLDNVGEIEKAASSYKDFDNALYIGRKYNAPIALEGALKLKEISYMHAEGNVAGELKHGPIALIDENFPTVALALSDSVYEKMLSNIQEIKARNGRVLAIATNGDDRIGTIADDVLFVPEVSEFLSPIVSVIPLQLFAYHVGVMRGYDVDKPRNLAKSVTVE